MIQQPTDLELFSWFNVSLGFSGFQELWLWDTVQIRQSTAAAARPEGRVDALKAFYDAYGCDCVDDNCQCDCPSPFDCAGDDTDILP